MAYLAVLAVGSAGCSSLFSVNSASSTSTTRVTPASTAPATSGADVAFPVATCTQAPPPSTTTTTTAVGTAFRRPAGRSRPGTAGGAARELAVHRSTGGSGTEDTTPVTPTTAPPVTQPTTPTTAAPAPVPATTPTTAAGGGSSSYGRSSYRGTTTTTQGSTGSTGDGTATVDESGHGWVPSILLAPLPTSLVGQVQFYSDGVHTVLGPAGWTCSILGDNSSAAGLAVYPSGTPSPPVGYPPPDGSEGVFAIFTNTGNSVGVGLVCTYFTVADWQKHEGGCGNPPPAGQKFSMATPDVASVTDPAGVAGTLSGSGGSHPVTGLVIFPQIQPSVGYGNPINVAVESCSLVNSTLCPAILSDFSVREFPSPTS